MAPAHAKSTGLGIENEELEVPFDVLPPWSEEKRKMYPVVRIQLQSQTTICGILKSPSFQLWKNPLTSALSFQVHPCAAAELLISPLPDGVSHECALYPDGAHLTDLKEVRDLLYKMQRPAIAPNVSIVICAFEESILT